MKYYFILILAFLQTTLSNCNTIARSRNVSTIKWKTNSKINCKRFKCPPVENLLCVRTRAKKFGAKAKDVYIVMFNECEFDYVKCIEGYQAAVVPMKNCGHHENLFGNRGNIRRKRSLKKDGVHKPNLSVPRMAGKLPKKSNVRYKVLSKKVKTVDEAEKSEDQDEAADDNGSGNDEGEEDDRHEEQEEGDTEHEEGDKEKEEGNKEEEEDGEDKEEEEQEEENNNTDDKQNESEKAADKDSAEKGPDNNQVELETDNADEENYESEYGSDVSSDADEKKKGKSLMKPNSNSTQDQRKDDDKLDNDYFLQAANDGVDFQEYKADCPTACPAQEVMICARCKEGVYRTFMSICHLRMFNCAHPEEKAELVSRYPCILSAPYLIDTPTPSGRVSEPGDVDWVLQFIRCRKKAELKRGDTDCESILKNGPGNKRTALDNQELNQ